MKKLISLILSAIMVFGLCTAALATAPEGPFENSMFYELGDYTLHYRVFEPEGAAEKQIMLVHGFCLSRAWYRACPKILPTPDARPRDTR